MSSMTIAKLAHAGGVGVETVRYYQRRGLMAEPERPVGGVRRYNADDVERLRFIRSAQAAGFTLEEIRELIDLNSIDDRVRVRNLARNRVKVLDARITELEFARNALARLAEECEAGSEGACPIISTFEREAAAT
jgi:MerR family mercuric resistance operon transcriptional regulator